MFSENFNNIKTVVFEFVLSFALSVIIVLFVFTSSVSASDPEPLCFGGELTTQNILSSFQLTLNCANLSTFSNGGQSLSELSDLVNIALTTDTNTVNPYRAEIIGQQIVISFFSYDISGYYGINNRELFIDQSVLLGSVLPINIPTVSINDSINPISENDSYTISGTLLEVSSQQGVLSNDTEMQSQPMRVVLVEDVAFGFLVLNEDGSFEYQPSDPSNAWATDNFTYRAVDGSGNFGEITNVLISNAPPSISGDFYKLCQNCQINFAKVGDVLRVDIETSKPVNVDSMVVGGNLVEDFYVVDATHFYFTYQMSESDEAGAIYYSVTVSDYSGNTVTYSPEDSVYFDKTPPEITLNSDEYTELYLYDEYEDYAVAYDEVSGLVNVIRDGLVDNSTGGWYYLYYSAVDQAGNVADPVLRSFYVIDNIPPIVTIDKINNSKQGDIVKIGGGIDDESVDMVVVANGRNFVVPAENIKNNRWFLKFFNDDTLTGLIDMTVFATDKFGNFGTNQTSFFISMREKYDEVHASTSQAVISANSNYNARYEPGVVEYSIDQVDQPTRLRDVDVQINQTTKKRGASLFFGIEWYYWLMLLSVCSLLLFWIFGK